MQTSSNLIGAYNTLNVEAKRSNMQSLDKLYFFDEL